MRIAIVTPRPEGGTVGGAERAWTGLRDAIHAHTGHSAELVSLPVAEDRLVDLIDAYRRFTALDVSAYDLVITSKYPAWMVQHPNHIVHVFHTLRGLYDTYHRTGLPLQANPREPVLQRLLDQVRRPAHRDGLGELYAAFDQAVAELGPEHPQLGFPGPLARELVHHLDRAALDPREIRRHFALSATVAGRADYFPPSVTPTVVHLPSGLSGLAPRDGDRAGFFTASRLDGPKRVALLIEAMAHVDADVTLTVAGTGPEEADLRRQAAGDPRIELLGPVDDEDLARRYAGALAVPFVPDDEDLGLITLEAMACGVPVVTTFDAGGPTEFVVNGVNGLVTAPDAVALGRALAHLAAEPSWAARLGRSALRTSAGITWEGAVAALLEHAPEPAVVMPVGHKGRRPRVVATSTYAVNPPHGGGQLRYVHLYGALAAHADVEILSLVNPARPTVRTVISPGLAETIIGVSDAQFEADVSLSLASGIPVTDIVAGQGITSTPAYLDALRAALDDADAVLLSHPYLLPAVEAVGSDLPLVYDAHNAEADMKERALAATAVGRDLAAWTAEVEGRAVRRATHVVTCSAEDADALGARFGRGGEGFVLIPNGTVADRPVPTPEERAERGRAWRHRWAATCVDRGVTQPNAEAIAVFFASWHPPNIDAAEVILDLAGAVPEVVFVLAGSHSDHFRRRTLPANVVLAGVVTEVAKNQLLASADVALNPMRQGSGTNLKIVEYFAAGIPTVSTPFGARGLEVDDRHLALAELDQFPEAIRAIIGDPAAAAERAEAARHLVISRYDWQLLGDRLAQVVADAIATRADGPSAVDGVGD